MNEWQQFIRGKKITVMGLGLLGRGVGDVRFLAEQGAILTVTDMKTEVDLAPSLALLADLTTITYHLGGHQFEDFQTCDFVLKAAGVPNDSPYLLEAARHNIPVEMSTALFAAFTPATIVGITGTRGKSTVTHCLYHILKHAYAGTDRAVFLGGNVQGVATLPFLAETKAGDTAVLELDSWQLQGFGIRAISPHLSVFTTFLPDHMNYYKNDMAAYFADKAQIFLNQKENDILVVGASVAQQSVFTAYKEKIQAKIVTVPQTGALSTVLPDDWRLLIPGDHNRANCALAVAAARELGIDEEIIKNSVTTFTGVSGRLSLVRIVGGVSFYNDTTATTPDAAVVAMKALGEYKQSLENRRLIMIVGGADKMLDMSKMLSTIGETVKQLIVLPGTGTMRIEEELAQSEVPMVPAESMQAAVALAHKYAQPGDVVLLSPGFASFGLFKNEYDRGDQFVAAVQAL
jgi:UDP-N-acetylmuramoylalanine--D-glutamate ligase